jgi:ketosteroid isomerase-like protein
MYSLEFLSRPHPRAVAAQEGSMRTLQSAAIPALIVLLATGCQPPAEEPIPIRTVEQAQADVEALRARWQELANADDFAGVASLYTEDASLLDQYGGTSAGKAAIAAYFEKSLPLISGYDIKVTETLLEGNMVTSYGTWSGTMGETPLAGGWQTVGMYQPDGSLKLRLHFSTVPAPAPTPPPPGT